MLGSDTRFLDNGFKPTSQEAIELYQELEIDIVTLGRLTVSRANVVAVEIDTYRKKPIVSLLF